MKTWRVRFALFRFKKNVHEEVTMEQSSINHLIRFSFTDWHFIGVMVFEPDNCETRYIKKCVKGEAFKHTYYMASNS